MTKQTIASIPVNRPAPTKRCPQGICLDKGYDYDEVRDLLKAFGFTAHIRSRGEEVLAMKNSAGFQARRWAVERGHSWMNRFRGVLIRWSKKADNYIGQLHFVLGIITWRQAGLLG